jgi:hypothetical protein
MPLKYAIYDTHALAYVGEPKDDFTEAYLAAQAHNPSAQIVAVETSDSEEQEAA